MFTLLNPQSDCPVLLLCEHADNKIPEELGDLGLSDPSILKGHHGFDPPMKQITQRLADKLDATAIMGNYTRLLVDLNRPENNPDLIPPHYFGYDIPGNTGLSEEQRARRIAMYYAPYHAQIAFQLDRLKQRGKTPFLFSLHSFTENPGQDMPPRPWDIGLLYNRYETSAHYFDHYLTTHHPELMIGHNQPYSLKEMPVSSVIQHGQANDLPYLLIELKNEAFNRGEQTHEQWADIFHRILTKMMSEEVF